MKNKLTYKQIAKMIGKTEANIKYLKKTNPQLLEIIKFGCEAKIKEKNDKLEDKNL